MTASHFIQEPQEVNYSPRPGSPKSLTWSSSPRGGDVNGILCKFLFTPCLLIGLENCYVSTPQGLLGFPGPVFACLLCCLTWRLRQQSVWRELEAKAMQKSGPESPCLLPKVLLCSFQALVNSPLHVLQHALILPFTELQESSQLELFPLSPLHLLNACPSSVSHSSENALCLHPRLGDGPPGSSQNFWFVFFWCLSTFPFNICVRMSLALCPRQAYRFLRSRTAWLSSLAFQHQGQFLTLGVTFLVNLYCKNDYKGLALGCSGGFESEVGHIMCIHSPENGLFSFRYPGEKDGKVPLYGGLYGCNKRKEKQINK